MKEQKLKALLEKSKIETSTNFTENLMANIELNNETKNSVIWPFKQVFLIVVFLMITLSYMLFNFSNVFIKINIYKLKIPILLTVSITFLLCINHLIKLNENHRTHTNISYRNLSK